MEQSPRDIGFTGRSGVYKTENLSSNAITQMQSSTREVMHNHQHIATRAWDTQTRLAIAFFMTAAFTVAEVVGGILFNSLALLADAGHMLSDILALGLTWIAMRIGKRLPTDRLTFGFKRSEILAALLNGFALWAIVAIIFYEAAHRLLKPQPVIGLGMLLVALVGLCVNLLMAWLLFGSRGESLNIKSAYIHVISDALGSLGAIVGAVVILTTGLFWVDPLVSVLIGLLIVYSSLGLIKQSINILMEGVPSGLDVSEIEQAVLQQNGVCCVYDLHVWSISGEKPALSAHVVLAESNVDRNEVLMDLSKLLKTKFNIDHATIQIEATHEMKPGAEGIACRPGTACGEFR